MKKWISMRRWSVRILTLLVLLTAMVVGTVARAQTASSVQLPKLTYTKNVVFHLPVQMEDRTRASLREVCLYVKSGSGDWVRQETGLPNMSHFSYKVPRDGEYWFSLVTVDKAGRMTPPDVSQEPPGLRVMVDTQPPVLDVQPWPTPEGDFCIRCQVQDANPDPQSLKAGYRDQTGEHVLEPMPGNPGVYKIVGREALNQPLKITAADLCGNVASREVNVRDMVVAALQMNNSQLQSAASKVVPVSASDASPHVPFPPVPSLPAAAAPFETVRTEVQKPSIPPLPPLPERSPGYPPPMTAPIAGQGPNGVLPPSGHVPSLPTIPPLPGAANELAMVKPGAVGTPGGVARQILNTTHATIDYRIDQVGPSGVGKVEVYLTGDGGLNWQRHHEDRDRRSPAEIELPGEGVFGIRLVITNGNGFGGTPPARGDAPTCWIEVDTTVPFVQLRPIDPAQNGVIELRWTASDKNLGPEPISLYYKISAGGPWQIIARSVKNEGLYRWNFPKDQGSQFFVKVEVSDLAGNTAHAESPNAIVLDITEPHASVVGVTGMAPRVTPPTGN